MDPLRAHVIAGLREHKACCSRREVDAAIALIRLDRRAVCAAFAHHWQDQGKGVPAVCGSCGEAAGRSAAEPAS